jgi:hypothetical protein
MVNEPSWGGNDKPLSAWLYLAPAFLLIFGGGLFGYVLFESINTLSASLIQTLMPGTTQVSLKKPGPYTVFHEYKSAFNGTDYVVPQGILGMQCSLTFNESGKDVELIETAGETAYSLKNRSGVSIFKFVIPKPGLFDFSCQYDDDGTEPKTVLTITQSIFGQLIKSIFVGFLIFGVAIFTGIISFYIIYLKRKQGMKEKKWQRS